MVVRRLGLGSYNLTTASPRYGYVKLKEPKNMKFDGRTGGESSRGSRVALVKLHKPKQVGLVAGRHIARREPSCRREMMIKIPRLVDSNTPLLEPPPFLTSASETSIIG